MVRLLSGKRSVPYRVGKAGGSGKDVREKVAG
jgi:hypothetical protein